MTSLFFYIVLFALAAVGTAQDRSLPEIIGEFRYAQPTFGYRAIGDRNGDGNDEFIISYQRDNRFDIYIGSNNMGGEVAHVINVFRENENVKYIQFLGRLTQDHPTTFVTYSAIQNQNETEFAIDFHSGLGEEQDSLYDTWKFHLSKKWSPLAPWTSQSPL